MTDDSQRLDILYGKINALEIVAEELFAELIRNTPNRDAVLSAVTRRSVAVGETFAKSDQLTPFVLRETQESLARLIQNLSLALSGNMRPRSRGQ